ncbi:seminal vesicle antigen-like 1 precursor [Rattus norvegicus]|uniref:Prolactin-inducible protein homolog n=1 Tax=Rattus norvegicus TaxID=10116 RepID=Q99N82_RAT|nr:seminal vesicle antigen-like 1 precursor [Rattus norvegicus]BAB39400.1 colon SVA-like protein [Rattus norvegicus]|eukprot:NP_579826.1 seminal vesicle antigen-like 1 precursor [Rattus norvegicus]
MASLQILYQPQAVIHVLILCLILEIASGQDNRNTLLSLNLEVSSINKANEFTVTLTVTNKVDKCMVVKISTEDNPNIKYLSAKATYTACICTIHNFFWDIHVSANTVLQGKAEVVPDKDICPDGENIFPVTSYVETVTSKILVMP